MKISIRSNSGFNLVELMATIVIVGILLAVAIPSYQGYTVKSKRIVAVGILYELVAHMERHYTETGRYSGATLPITTYPETGDTIYIFRFWPNRDQTDTTFTIEAQPKNKQRAAEVDDCGSLSVKNTGDKCVQGGQCVGSGGWKQKKAEQCFAGQR